MLSPTTVSLLLLILRADNVQVQVLAARQASAQPVDPGAACCSFDLEPNASLLELALNPNADRDTKLAEFLYSLTPARNEWLDAVKATEWDEMNWSSEAVQRFVESESHAIPGTVAFAVVAGAMAQKGFPVHKDLNKRLYGAKKTVEKHRHDLAEAERRREEELRGKREPQA